MKLPTCSQCPRTAAWRRPWDKVYLCKLHFNRSFIKRVRKTINSYGMLQRDDRIMVGISGGKDSVVLLDVLAEIERNYPAEIVAVTIDEGIAGYREDGLKYAKLAVERAGVEHHVYSFEDRFGSTLDTTLKVMGDGRLGACSYCGVFRRKLLNEAAVKLGVSKVATGHNADDEAQTILMNMVRGDLLKTLRSSPRPKQIHEDFIPRIKPFRWTTEQEIVLYAHFNELPYQEMPCPNAVEAQRGVIREILDVLRKSTPDVVHSIIKSTEPLHELGLRAEEDRGLSELLFGVAEPRNPSLCRNCGQPTMKVICRSCKIEKKIRDRLTKSGLP